MNEPFDVVVLGTGAGGLTAAVVAAEEGGSVAVFERADKVGGTSAWSGGHVWIPNNPHMSSVGASDSPEEALTYIMSLSRGMLDEALVRAYIDAGPQMVQYLDERTPTQFYAVADFPDYHPEFPGGKPGGGRTIECPLYPFDELGDWADRVTPSPYFPDPHITMSETPLGKAVPDVPDREERKRRRVRNERGCGQALVGRLLRGCLDRGVEPRTSCRARRLVLDDSGGVIGVQVDTPRGTIDVGARRGVVMATGGFEWNDEYKRAFVRGPLTHPVSIETSTGDGLYMSMKAGAMLGNMREAWWIPAIALPPGINSMNVYMLAGDRSRPRTIMVNSKGRRFSNEAANYNAFGAAFHAEDVARFDYANLPCWMVFDQGYVDKYGVLGLTRPGAPAPDWVTHARSVDELGDVLGIPHGSLQVTVDRWNDQVARGVDDDFHRGESAHDRWWGDPDTKGRVDASLGPLDQGPFYALEVHSGALGTKGGPKVDTNGQVIDLDGQPIRGLYAAGNVMASPFGMTYGGGGGTLGPAMVFAYLAARHATAGDRLAIRQRQPG